MMVKDPVCDMMVDEHMAAAQSTYAGQTYYFCSKECKDKFDRNPDRYTKQKQEPSSSMRR